MLIIAYFFIFIALAMSCVFAIVYFVFVIQSIFKPPARAKVSTFIDPFEKHPPQCKCYFHS